MLVEWSAPSWPGKQDKGTKGKERKPIKMKKKIKGKWRKKQPM